MHLYLHIPFCRRACHYCDFHFSTQLQSKSAVVEAMIKEIYLRQDYLQNKKLTTIYFGGGTPSLLNINELYDIFEAIHNCFEVAEDAEITLEINPDDVSHERLLIWQRFGINRLSIGIQSFENQYLTYLNRIHTAEMAEKSVRQAQNVGFENITIDLIYAINPLNTKASKRKQKTLPLTLKESDLHRIWKNDIKKAIQLKIPHISSYCLTIEEKTVFGNWLKNNYILPIEDVFAEKQYKELVSTLAFAGYEQYEISNFARNGFFAKHNTSYWQGEEYLGIGPSAHSYNGASRQYNTTNNAFYQKAIAENQLLFEEEILTQENRANELIMTGLRTKWGVDLQQLSDIIQPNESFEKTLELKIQQGVIEQKQQKIYLTEKGKLFADGIASALFF